MDRRRHELRDTVRSPDTAADPLERLIEAENEQQMVDPPFSEPEASEDRMLRVMQAVGLDEKRAKLLVYRETRGLTFNELAVELGYGSRGAAKNAYDAAIISVRKKHGKKS